MTESILTGLGTALAVVAALTPKARRFLHFVDDMMGEEERPEILERLTSLETRLDLIERRLNAIESCTRCKDSHSGVDGEA